MAKIIPITEHYQHFLEEMKESFWGDVYGETKLAWKRLLEADSERQRDRYAVRDSYERRAHRRQPYRNGYYERDFVTRRFCAARARVRPTGRACCRISTSAAAKPAQPSVTIRPSCLPSSPR
jgi:hypothetical protein